MSTLTHYRGGAIFTSDTRPWAESLVVEDGRITYVGDTVTAEALPIDETVELDGAVVLPGIVDAHTHLVSLGESLTQVDLLGAANVEEIQARLAEAAAG